MAKKVFISYQHNHADWVRNTLYPILSAGGVEITVDYRDFEAGIAVRKQMKERQTPADVHLLVLTRDYFQSDYCIEEMQCALAKDPKFEQGKVLPVILERCELPPEIKTHDPLHVDLSGGQERKAEQWRRLMRGCHADLGMPVLDWLRAFSTTVKALRERRSVNLLVKGRPKWREFRDQLKIAFPELGIVDLDSGKAVTRRGLIAEILDQLAGYTDKVSKDEDLAELERLLDFNPPHLLALQHFDKVTDRKYGNDLFSSLRYIIMEKRQLTLLVHSRTPFANLLPDKNTLSYLEMETVELGGEGNPCA
jgi:hypothetical protein